MKILKHQDIQQTLPFKTLISFEKLFEYFEFHKNDPNSLLKESASNILEKFKHLNILRDGFDDFTFLEKYSEEINTLTASLFPDLLQPNEIKALAVPFDMTCFKLSKRFEDIIKNAGDNFNFELRNFESEKLYIMACTYILGMEYNKLIDFKRPFFYDIPDVKQGHTKTYRALFNADFCDIIKADDAPDITEEDYRELINNIDDIEVWKQKFPPNSYILKGFGLINLFDVTQEETISLIKDDLIKRDEGSLDNLEKHIQDLYHLTDIKLGFSIYNKRDENQNTFIFFNTEHSLITCSDCNNINGYFCNGIVQRVFQDKIPISISDVEEYGIKTNQNPFYKTIVKNNIESIVLTPLDLDDNFIAILEVASPRKYELNTLSASKLKDIIPVLSIATQRSIEERKNLLESTIQEFYTTIHSSVKWKFHEQVDHYLNEVSHGNQNASLNSISFKSVYPIFGQCDIKGSSSKRNEVIKKDLVFQLNLSKDVLLKALKIEKLPIYEELLFRIDKYINNLEKNLDTGDELRLTSFFKNEIYPLFNHLERNSNDIVKKSIKNYFKEIDDTLQIVYKDRKIYENCITHINNKLSKHLDKQQKKAQKMFPHYYERFKTDGVEYNMYIGASINKEKEFNPIYIQNLRLWQLQQQCEMERIARQINIEETRIDLEIASLILVHSSPLDIQFRMDEKKFDVDGAYNMRYEIIKKRIDKSLIKNTEERLTQPNKIAIVYTHQKDALEYEKYINFLKKKGYLKGNIEWLDIEDLQGVSGLKALRVEVDYDDTKEGLSFDDLLDYTKKVVNH